MALPSLKTRIERLERAAAGLRGPSRLDVVDLVTLMDLATQPGGEGVAALWGPSVERPAGQGDPLVGAGLSLELPIFDQNQAQVARAGYRYRQMVKSYEAVYLAVAQDIRIAADRANTAISSMAFYQDQLLPQAQRNLSFAKDSYSAGQSSILALFEAQRSLLKARRGYVTVRLESATALADLEQTVGSPLGRIRELEGP